MCVNVDTLKEGRDLEMGMVDMPVRRKGAQTREPGTEIDRLHYSFSIFRCSFLAMRRYSRLPSSSSDASRSIAASGVSPVLTMKSSILSASRLPCQSTYVR